MGRRVITVLLPQVVPEPAYDTYEMLRTDAEGKSRRPLGPQDLQAMYDVAQKRSTDWCTAVLGYAFPGIDRSSTVDGWMLILADEMDLNPPLPHSVIEARKQLQEIEERRNQQAKERREREQCRWDTALAAAAAGVDVAVRENTRHSGVNGALRHATPADDLVSGRSRKHLADRALCETARRANPLALSEPVDAPANCVRCLDYMGKVRPLTAPASPTSAQEG
ncbi:hypothetical protein ACIBAC_00120 [Streptomyces sp. NPDC051362]|uniref:hypothetical protein n=1 Tax=Streptomyces sp. NPDC051362 TaxID=3365651 RepID=UPI0037BB03FB